MKYELLMHYESMKPVNYKEQTEAEWGTLETTAEGFFCIEIECEEWNIATLMKDYYYDPMEDKFIHETLGIEFDQKLAPEPVEDTTPIQNLVECAKSIDPNWSQTEHDACEFLHPQHAGEFEEARVYAFNKYCQFKDIEHMDEFLQALLYKNYGGVWKVGKKFSQDTWDILLASDIFIEADKDWMRKLWSLT